MSKRNSLRLANGRGLDFCEDKTITSELPLPLYYPQQQEQEQEQEQQQVVPTIMTTEFWDSGETDEDKESMRKQISTLLALGRKDIRRRRSSGSRPSTPPPCLSPLALEAQEYFPDTPSQDDVSDEDEEEEEDDESVKEAATVVNELPPITMETGLKDPCEHIAFMLVPKSRYEFQPLVVQ